METPPIQIHPQPLVPVTQEAFDFSKFMMLLAGRSCIYIPTHTYIYIFI